MDPDEKKTVGFNGSETGCCSALLVMVEKGNALHMPKPLLCKWLDVVRSSRSGPARARVHARVADSCPTGAGANCVHAFHGACAGAATGPRV